MKANELDITHMSKNDMKRFENNYFSNNNNVFSNLLERVT